MGSRQYCRFPVSMTNPQTSSGLPHLPLSVTPARMMWAPVSLLPPSFNTREVLNPPVNSTFPLHPFTCTSPSNLCKHTLVFPLQLVFGTRHLSLLIRHPVPVLTVISLLLLSQDPVFDPLCQTKLHQKSQDRGCSPSLPGVEFSRYVDKQKWLGSREHGTLRLPEIQSTFLE